MLSGGHCCGGREREIALSGQAVFSPCVCMCVFVVLLVSELICVFSRQGAAGVSHTPAIGCAPLSDVPVCVSVCVILPFDEACRSWERSSYYIHLHPPLHKHCSVSCLSVFGGNLIGLYSQRQTTKL